ncbi:DUF4398 domain-containing protein [Syntrophorhabdus aromaticivorans]|jgi:hypothetical protein|uniref:DUF4398 domain-containing protein n=1 Tax=Syntrophorhabdus aromaticivorans TaxID=328301 RepID=UPI0003FE3D37|nr:DUF4398 domain-containing protein [Syntrophorhabdus aromaticivorans]HBA54224.1 DUF4398 domain-containing protein [Syntrophorhabdus aromaticivorans]
MLKRCSCYAFFFVITAFSLMLVTGCAKPPTEEIAAAEKAIEEAKAKEANLYAESAFKSAEESLKKAKDMVAAKTYKEAKQAALDTATLAQQAVSGIEAGKAKMKEEAEKSVLEVQKLLDDLKVDVAAAIKKKLPVPKEEVQAAIGKWEVDFTATKEKLQGGKIHEALNELKAMMDAVKAKKDQIAQLDPAAQAAAAAQAATPAPTKPTAPVPPKPAPAKR